jgi:hypothetical protein
MISVKRFEPTQVSQCFRQLSAKIIIMQPSGDLGIVVIPGGGVSSKLLAFDTAVKNLYHLTSLQTTDAQGIKGAVSEALDAIHSLENQRRRREWSMNEWSTDDRDLWSGHIAVRNVDHHQSASIIHIDHQGDSGMRCRWAISEDSLSRVQGRPEINGADAYSLLLDQRPVLIGLNRLLSLVQSAIQ